MLFPTSGWVYFWISSTLKQQEDVLHEEWYNIVLETVQNLYESISRRIQAVLQANVGPAPYL